MRSQFFFFLFKFVFNIYGSFWCLIFFYPLPSTGLTDEARLRERRLQLALAVQELQRCSQSCFPHSLGKGKKDLQWENFRV